MEISNKLLQALSRWRGRRLVQASLESKGFRVHRAWQERRLAYCGKDNASNVERYWDEFAMECVCNAGYVNSNSRWFGQEPTYRSAYLDKLAKGVDYATTEIRNPQLLKCLFEYNQKWRNDLAFVEREVSYF